MTPLEYFNRCNDGPWITAGRDVQYKMEDGVLYFQASSSIRSSISDWIYNFMLFSEPYRDCGWKIHKGAKLLWKSVEEVIAPLLYPNMTIVGYSQGAWLAQLAHEYDWFNNSRQPRTITFGSPALSLNPSPELLSRFAGVTNYHVKGDIVAGSPPWLAVAGKRVQLEPGTWYPSFKMHAQDAYREALKYA
jgi:pimeloyl-ACP methyl ester carboxylesterase